MIFLFTAEGDSLYVEANDREHAEQKFFDFLGGAIPNSVYRVQVVDRAPEGEEVL